MQIKGTSEESVGGDRRIGAVDGNERENATLTWLGTTLCHYSQHYGMSVKCKGKNRLEEGSVFLCAPIAATGQSCFRERHVSAPCTQDKYTNVHILQPAQMRTRRGDRDTEMNRGVNVTSSLEGRCRVTRYLSGDTTPAVFSPASEAAWQNDPAQNKK